MMNYFSDKADVVRYVKKGIQNLPVGSQLTITIEREKYADFYATSATIVLSDDTRMLISSKGLDVT